MHSLLHFRRGAIIVRRRFHASRRLFAEDSEEEGRATAENVILQRINSPTTTLHPSLSHLKVDKEPKQQQIQKEPMSISSVSGIIDSVRETRAACQRSPWHRDNPAGVREEEEVSSFHFDTLEMVERLRGSGLTGAQAAAITTVVKRRVHVDLARVQSLMLTKSDLENDAYLFRAALAELRVEMQMTRKSEQSLLESQAAGISREIESLFQRTNDQIANLRSDIEIEMNNHKHDTRLAMKGMDMELHELATKYQMRMGEMKTDIEAVKLGSIRRGLITVVLTAVFLSAIFWGPRFVKKVKSRRNKPQEEVVAPVPDTSQGSDSGSDLVAAPSTGTLYRDYSHLDIRYQPTMSGSDDWFDSANYPPPKNHASLVDSQLDSTFWDQETDNNRIPVLHQETNKKEESNIK